MMFSSHGDTSGSGDVDVDVPVIHVDSLPGAPLPESDRDKDHVS